MKPLIVLSLIAALCVQYSFAAEQIPQNRARQILAAAPEKPSAAPKKARRVLIWNTPAHLMAKDPHAGYCIPYGSAALEAIGKKSGAYEPIISDDLAMYLPENLRQFDAIVMNNTSGAWITPTEADLAKQEFKKLGNDAASVEQKLRQALLDYVNNGGGIVALHFAIAANRHWLEFKDLIGGTFTGHPWNEEIGVTVEDRGSPLVAAYGGKDFRIADEIYEYGPPFSREKVRVLMSLDTERSNMGVKWINRKDGDFALAWVKTWGKGRIFNTSFGHRTELFWNRQLLQFYLDAVQFAAGDLDAPTEPRSERPQKVFPGPTPPEVRMAKMKAKNIALPTDEQVRQIEAAAPDQAPAKPLKKRKVLVWGHTWTHEPNPYAEKAIEVLARKTQAFEAVISDDPRLLLGDRLPQFDVLVMNNIHEAEPFLRESFNSLDAEQKKAANQFDEAVKTNILAFVRSGKGLVGTHAATAACNNWLEYGEMIGGYYGGHILQDVAIKVEHPQHPVVAAFAGKPFRIKDEIYIFREPYARKNVQVLLSLDLAQMADPGKRPDKDYPVSWVRDFGKGRVFYTTLGHVAETHWNPLFLQHLLAAIQYAAGDLPAPSTSTK